jgi:hypothetical protein
MFDVIASARLLPPAGLDPTMNRSRADILSSSLTARLLLGFSRNVPPEMLRTGDRVSGRHC